MNVSPVRAPLLTPPLKPVTQLSWNFDRGPQGFSPLFVDLPASEPDRGGFYELEFGSRALPRTLGPGKGLFVSGNNHSDDLKMLVKKQLTGLKPNTTYRIDLEVTLGTNAPANAAGVGGAPGEGVTFKAGASPVEPRAVIRTDTGSRYRRLNLDLGEQTQPGRDGRVLGNMAKRGAHSDDDSFRTKTLKTSQALSARTDAQGRLWLVAGTDSGFEATTAFYLMKIGAKLRAA